MLIRLLDIFFSLFAILILSPLLLAVVVILSFTGEREIFYVQERMGLSGKPFGLLKFATMLKASPSIGTGTVTLKNDPRVLPVGRFLRKTKINELPQLFNILMGHMSVVGPRPLVKHAYDSYPDSVKGALEHVKPGLTGIGSILFRDEESILGARNDAVEFHRDVIGKYKGELEIWFVENKSITLYILVVILTAWVVVFPGKNGFLWRIFPTLPKPNSELAELLV